MYVPKVFRVEEREPLVEVIRRYPLGLILLADDEGMIEIAQAPCVLADDASAIRFHLARGNPVARRLQAGPCPVQIVFTGPDAYVSPTWYEQSEIHVPTWNYLSVHIRSSRARKMDESGLLELLRRSSERFESDAGASGWALDVVDEAEVADMLRAISGFEVALDHVEGKFKLSQNRSPGDRERVRLALEASSDPRARDLAGWMLATLAN